MTSLKTALSLLALLTIPQFAAADPAVLRWNFDAPTEVIGSRNINFLEVKDGQLSGRTAYDPFFSLALPKDGFDASRLTQLKLRLFSSAPADTLALYFKSPNGDWAMGATKPIVEGWNVYSIDLTREVRWSEGSGPEAKSWGGREKKVSIFRLDPGNQADRDINLDWVQLEPASTQADSWFWKDEGDLLGWTHANFEKLNVRGLIRATTNHDPRLVSPALNLDAKKYQILEFKAKSNMGGGGQIFFRHADDTISEARMIRHSIIGDNQFHVYRVKLNSNDQWTGTITQVRFDPIDPSGTDLEIEYLRFLPNNGGLVSNASFEVPDPARPEVPEYWAVKTKNATVLLSDAASQGQKGLRIVSQPGGQASLASKQLGFLRTGSYDLAFDYDLESSDQPASLQVRLPLTDIFRKPLGKPLTFNIPLKKSTGWSTTRQTLAIPALAAAGNIEFELQSAGASKLSLDNLRFNPVEPAAKVNSDVESWKAVWVKPKDAGEDSVPLRNFRKSFTLPQVPVQSARVLITADNVYRLFVNGTEIPTGAPAADWTEPETYNIGPLLRPGPNTIAVITTNENGAEGLLAEVGIRLANGQSILLKTDATWKATVGLTGDAWTKRGFNDQSWPVATVVAPVPGGAWGKIPYRYLGAAVAVTVNKFSLPVPAISGLKTTITLECTPETSVPSGTKFFLELAQPGREPIPIGEYLLTNESWPAGKTQTKSFAVSLPKFFENGNYQLRFHAPGILFAQSPAASKSWTALADGAIAQPIRLQGGAPPANPVAKLAFLPGKIPAFEIDGKIHPVSQYMTDNADSKILANLRANGINLIWLNIPAGFGWNGRGKYDFSAMDRLCRELLEKYPAAYLVLNVPLDPVYNPGMKSWLDRNPGELAKNAAGDTNIGGYHGAIVKGQSYASKVWLDDASDAFRSLIRHVRSNRYGERVIGYVPISGLSWEWFYWGAQSQEFVDYSAPFTKAWQGWLQQKYGNIERLNSTWKSNHATFSAVPLPSKEARLKTDVGTFLDPALSRNVIDLREFFSEVISDDILAFCRVVKEETKNTAICGTYYGYVMYVLGPYLPAHTGHFALGKVLRSPDIDFVMSPSRYTDRGLGGSSGFMMPVDSIKLHNKLYIDQADIRTVHATGPSGQVGYVDSLEGSAAILQREFANTVTAGVACQYYDFGKGWTGADPRLTQVVGRLRQIEARLQKEPRHTMSGRNSIAVIVDEKSTLYTGIESSLHVSLIDEQITELQRSGIGFDTYLLDDLEKMPDYSCYLFLNTFRITGEQQRWIDSHLKTANKTLIWTYAPGITDGNTLSPQRPSQITGINLTPDTKEAPLRVRLTNSNVTYGSNSASPTFSATEGETLGIRPDTNQPALVRKKFPNWTSIYSLAPRLPISLLRDFANSSGVPVRNSTLGDITYTSDRLLAVHTVSGGPRQFPYADVSGKVEELFSGRMYDVKDGILSVDLPENSTSLFLLPVGK